MSTQSQTSKSSAASTTEKPKLKICIRNLPPQLTEEQFYISIQPFLNDIDFQYYVPGKIKYFLQKIFLPTFSYLICEPEIKIELILVLMFILFQMKH